MSARKPLKKSTLPAPPQRARPNSNALAPTRPKKTESGDRSRSRSAKPPNRPNPPLPNLARSRSRGKLPLKNKQLPTPQPNKHRRKPSNKSKKVYSRSPTSSPASPASQASSRTYTKKRNKPPTPKTKPPAKPDISTKPKNPPSGAHAWRRNRNKNKNSIKNRNYRKKVSKKTLPKTKTHLPNPPTVRIRSKTGPSRPLPESASPQVDNRPSLKPSLSSKRGRHPKEKTVTIFLERSSSHDAPPDTKATKKSTKATKHGPSRTCTSPPKLNSVKSHESEEKLATPAEPIYVSPPKASKRAAKPKKTRSHPPSSKLPPPQKSGHRRDYSIVKSIPSQFKKKKSLKKTDPAKQGRFGLTVQGRQRKRGFATMTDKREGLISASCQCGGVKYEVLALPQELQHCYCTMCRKMHGSAVATWCPFLENDIRFIRSGKQTRYRSSDKVMRSFCSVCGSNISVKYGFQRDTIWFTPSLFDGATRKYANDTATKRWWDNVQVLHIFCGSKCEWYQIAQDGQPQLSQNDIQNSEIHGEPRFMHNSEVQYD